MANFPVPMSGFTWCQPIEILFLEKNVKNISQNSPYGFMINADFTYPASLHEAHNLWPLLVESRACGGGKNRKLVGTLEDKFGYTAFGLVKQALESIDWRLFKASE